MTKFLIGLLLLTSFSVFAEELTGLKCSTNYVLHEVSRAPYEINRVVLRKNLLGRTSVLGFTPIDNHMKDFMEEFNLADSREVIIYSLDVQADSSVLSMKVKTKDNEVALLDGYVFKTKSGFARQISLLDLIQQGTQQATNVFISCLPVFK